MTYYEIFAAIFQNEARSREKNVGKNYTQSTIKARNLFFKMMLE